MSNFKNSVAILNDLEKAAELGGPAETQFEHLLVEATADARGTVRWQLNGQRAKRADCKEAIEANEQYKAAWAAHSAEWERKFALQSEQDAFRRGREVLEELVKTAQRGVEELQRRLVDYDRAVTEEATNSNRYSKADDYLSDAVRDIQNTVSNYRLDLVSKRAMEITRARAEAKQYKVKPNA